MVVAEGDLVGAVQYETDRGRFLGRGRTAGNPIAVMEDRRFQTRRAPCSIRFSVCAVVCEFSPIKLSVYVQHCRRDSREEAMALADKYHDPNIFERELRLAWTQGTGPDESLEDRRGRGAPVSTTRCPHCLFRSFTAPAPHVLALNTKAQSSLWAHGIGGDLPIVVVRISKEMICELSESSCVVMSTCIQRSQRSISLFSTTRRRATCSCCIRNWRRSYAPADCRVYRTSPAEFTCVAPIKWRRPIAFCSMLWRALLSSLNAARSKIRSNVITSKNHCRRPLFRDFLRKRILKRLAPPDLSFFNGLGGFHQGGREYVTLLGAEQWTPAPWSNVIGNSVEFGFLVTESGGGCTWSLNSRENRLTPWSNDAVCDPPGEVVYLRDEDSGNGLVATRCRFESESRTSSGTARATVFSNIRVTGYCRSCSSLRRWMRR